ncbi:hypothetical protein ALUC_70775S [Aspergillus luchuensis]|nr:hypothetical protein ALUC_70775S [Aspergillus luchuensis]
MPLACEPQARLERVFYCRIYPPIVLILHTLVFTLDDILVGQCHLWTEDASIFAIFSCFFSILTSIILSPSPTPQYDLPVMYLVNGNENKALRPLPSLPLASVILPTPKSTYSQHQGIIY